MIKNLKRIVLLCCTAATVAFAACSDSKSEGGNPDSDDKTHDVTFTSATGLEYYGDRHENNLGNFVLTLKTDVQTLYLDVTSALAGDPSAAALAVGSYKVSAAGSYESMSFDQGASYWMMTEAGKEVRYKLSSGEFAVADAGNGQYKLSGKLSAPDGTTLNFTFTGALQFENKVIEPIDPDAIRCLSAYGTYYGKYYYPFAADYYIVLYDTKHTSTGDPYNYRVVLDFTSAFPAAGAIMPQTGTYTIDNDMEFKAQTFVPGHLTSSMSLNGTMWQVPSGGGATSYPVTGGTFSITKNGASYRIAGTLTDAYDRTLKFVYDGALQFNNEAVADVLSQLDADRPMGKMFYANTKCYSKGESVNLWKLYLYDEASWTSQGSDGYFIAFDLTLDPTDEFIPSGTYGPTDILRPAVGGFIPGYLYAGEEAVGSWLAKAQTTYAPAKGGSVTVKTTDGANYEISFDATDDHSTPFHMTGSFDGPVKILSSSLVGGGSSSQSAPVLTSGAKAAPRTTATDANAR